jgi:hypothetical protein
VWRNNLQIEFAYPVKPAQADVAEGSKQDV